MRQLRAGPLLEDLHALAAGDAGQGVEEVRAGGRYPLCVEALARR